LAEEAMTLQEFSEKFAPLPAQEKIRFIYTNIDSLGREDKTSFLLSVLKEEDSSPLVKATALKFLRAASYPESELYQHFIDDEFRAISNAAKAAVKELGEKKKDNDYYTAAVLRKLRSLADKDRRLKILRAVARLKAPWVSKVLVEALDDPAEKNREFLIGELVGRENWSPSSLYGRLTQPPWYARSAALKILAQRTDDGALQAIQQTLGDPNVDVRRSAAEALGEIGGQDAVGMLVRLTKDGNIYVRQAAAGALSKISRVRFSG
jgi:HEAT repeat protein